MFKVARGAKLLVQEIELGGSPTLLLQSLCVCAYTMIFVVVLIYMKCTEAAIARESDESIISMSDYSVVVWPDTPWELNALDHAHDGGMKHHEEELIDEVHAWLSHEVGEVAMIDKKPCIVVAYDEDENIQLWRKKTALLQQLEIALAKCCIEQSIEPVFKAGMCSKSLADKIEQLNAELDHLARNHPFKAICIYVTFEWEPDCAYALREFGSVKSLMHPDEQGFPDDGEDLANFSQAYEDGDIENEDDDYLMDTKEELEGIMDGFYDAMDDASDTYVKLIHAIADAAEFAKLCVVVENAHHDPEEVEMDRFREEMGGAGAGDRELQSFGVGSGTNYASLE